MLLLPMLLLLLLLLPSCDAGLLFKHASVPQVVSSVKAEYPPVGNYVFNAYLSLIGKKVANCNKVRLYLENSKKVEEDWREQRTDRCIQTAR